MFETLIIQPIYNLLIFIYANVPGNDFGIAVIIFTVAIRFLMWPMLRKQLHQTRVLREIQPEIKKINKKYADNKQLIPQKLLELYQQKGISPFSSLGLLFVQLPVFFGLFAALRALLSSPERIIRLPYEFLKNNNSVSEIAAGVADKTNQAISGLSDMDLKNSLLEKLGDPVSVETLQSLPKEELVQLYNNDLVIEGANGVNQFLVEGPFFEQSFLNAVDLSRQALQNGEIYWPLMLVAIFAGVLQFIQTRQLTPKKTNQKTIREILQESSTGKEPDQSEINAAVSSKMSNFFAPLIWYISAISPGGLALYFATSGLVGFIQQRFILDQDVREMEEVAVNDNPKSKTKSKNSPKNKSKNKPKKKSKRN